MPWQIFGPCRLPVSQGWLVPHLMTQEEKGTFTDEFVSVSKRALQASYKVFEIHGSQTWEHDP